MKTTKIMLTGFAIFAAMLMLMTTSLAGPISESTNLNAVENAQQELVDSMNALFEKIERDQELNNLLEQMIKQHDRNSRPTSLENTDGIDKEALKALKDYLERTYFTDLENIKSQASNLQEELLPDQNTDVLTVSPEILGFLPIYGAIYPVGDVTELSGCSTPAGEPDYIYDFDSGEIYLNGHDITGHVVGDGDANTVDGVEAEYAGFLFNQDGGMYVPGVGWIYPDDPLWDDWFDIHTALQGLPASVLPWLSILLFSIAVALDNFIYYYEWTLHSDDILLLIVLFLPYGFALEMLHNILEFGDLVGWRWTGLFDDPLP